MTFTKEFSKNDYFAIHEKGAVIEEIRWAIATLIEIVFCIVAFALSGFFPSKDEDYNNRVNHDRNLDGGTTHQSKRSES